MKKIKCEECKFFIFEDVDGLGRCDISKVYTKYNDNCWLNYNTSEVITILQRFLKCRQETPNMYLNDPTSVIIDNAINKAMYKLIEDI